MSCLLWHGAWGTQGVLGARPGGLKALPPGHLPISPRDGQSSRGGGQSIPTMGNVPRSGDWGDQVDSYCGFCDRLLYSYSTGRACLLYSCCFSQRGTQFKRADSPAGGSAAPPPRLSADCGAVIALPLQSAGPGNLSISAASWGVSPHVPPPRVVSS